MAVQFNSYLLCAFFLDATSERQGKNWQKLPPFAKLHEKVSKKFEEYDKEWRKQVDLLNIEVPSREENSCLNQVRSYIGFGQADLVSFAMVDGFHQFSRFTTELSIPVKQSYLGFCPKPSSYYSSRKYLRSPHQLFNDRNEESHPFVCVTRFKVGGLAVLGPGPLWQEAILKSSARRLHKILDGLTRYARKNPKNKFDLDPESIQSTRASFIYSLGSEDLVLILTANNLSTAMKVVLGVREQKLSDLVEFLPRGMLENPYVGDEKKSISISNGAENDGTFFIDCVETLGRITKQTRQPISQILKCSIFADTHTTIGATFDCFPSAGSTKPPRKTYGVVEAYPRLHISPRDFDVIEKRSNRFLKKHFERVKKIKRIRTRHCNRILVGRDDYDSSLSGNSASKASCMKIGQFLRSTHKYYNSLIGENSRLQASVRNYSSGLVVPVPRDSYLKRKTNPQRQARSIDPLLAAKKAKLKERKKRQKQLEAKEDPIELALNKYVFSLIAKDGKGALFEARKLRKAMKTVRLPIPLRRSIELLFKNYITYLSDITCYESVLDLLDFFVEFYQFLVDDLVELFEQCKQRLGPKCNLPYDKIGIIGDLLDAAQSALAQRTFMLPNADNRDSSLAWRGGLNQLVAAVDVPLKCGLGLVNQANDQSDLKQKDEARHDRDISLSSFVGVTRLSYRATPKCISTSVKRKNYTQNLVIMDMITGYVVSPFTYVDCFHEASHLLFMRNENYTGDIENEAWNERVQEIYADCVTYFFVFNQNRRLYHNYNIIRFDNHPISGALNERVRAERFAEVLVRCFLVTEIIEKGSANPRWFDRIEKGDLQACKQCRDDFLEFVRNQGKLFSGFEGVMRYKVPFEQRCTDLINYVLKSTAFVFREIFADCSAIYNNYRSQNEPWSHPNGREKQQRYFLGCMRRSEAPNEYELKKELAKGKDSIELEHCDPLAFVSDLLYAYFRQLYYDLPTDSSMHIVWNAEAKFLKKKPNQAIHDYWIDPSYQELLTWSRDCSQKKLDAEMCVIEGLWGMSCRLRGRRLTKLLKFLMFDKEEKAKRRQKKLVSKFTKTKTRS